MKPEAWGVVIAILGVVSIVGAVYYLVRDNFKQASKINKLEHEVEKEKARETLKDDHIDTVIDLSLIHI